MRARTRRTASGSAARTGAESPSPSIAVASTATMASWRGARPRASASARAALTPRPWEERALRLAQCAALGLVHRARREPGAARVDEHRGRGALERVDERVGPARDHGLDTRRQALGREARDHGGAGGVVAERRAEADHEDAHRGGLRSSSSVRKWVAHEMHGS